MRALTFFSARPIPVATLRTVVVMTERWRTTALFVDRVVSFFGVVVVVLG